MEKLPELLHKARLYTYRLLAGFRGHCSSGSDPYKQSDPSFGRLPGIGPLRPWSFWATSLAGLLSSLAGLHLPRLVLITLVPSSIVRVPRTCFLKILYLLANVLPSAPNAATVRRIKFFRRESSLCVLMPTAWPSLLFTFFPKCLRSVSSVIVLTVPAI
jgi:hypothetical protein